MRGMFVDDILDKTSTLLVQELEALPKNESISEIINKAKQLYYDDFQSGSPTPKMDLFYDLRKAGLGNFAKDVVNGKYD